MAASFANIYHHRKVADTASKPCEICFRPTSSVLITPESKDFFYTCPGHLKDRSFCSPIVDKEAEAARRKKEMEDEMAKVKADYEAKQREKEKKKKEQDENAGKEKEREKGKEEGKDGDADKNKGDEAELATKEPVGQDYEKDNASEPRIFALHRTFYQQRIDKKRQAEMARRNRQRLQDPNYFPSVPTGQPKGS